MRFGIAGFGGTGFVELSEAEFTQAKRAKESLATALFIEDKFDLLLENYAEFERELLGLAVHRMIYDDLSWGSGHSDIQNVNRRVTNLLSSGRLYIDHIRHDAGALDCADSSIGERLKKKLSEQYDSKLGYRVMEALRNYTLHRALPVDGLSYPSAWEPRGKPENLVYRVVPRITVAELLKDGSVKKPLIADLSAIGPEVSLTPLIREYVEGLSIVHGAFRELVQTDATRWESTFDCIWSRYLKVTGQPQKVVQIVAMNEDGQCQCSEHIFEDLITHRNELARKNPVLTNLARRFVSGACMLSET